MTRRQPKTFGQTLRSLMDAKGLSLRAAAKAAQISPTYLSQLLREQSQPSEHIVFKLAEALDFDGDELFAMTNRIAADLQQIILKQPRETAALLLALDGLPAAEIEKLTRRAEQLKSQLGSKG